LDGAGLEIFKNALETIADEMAIILIRSAYSPIVRDVMDFATTIADAEGRPVAQGLTQPFHLGSFQDALVSLGKLYAGRIRPGDVFIGNDPYAMEGQHLPDIFIIMPVFHDGVLFGWAATFAHHVDIGGIVPGSNALGSTEIFQEGLRLPFLKLVDGGRINQTIFDIIALNVRAPDSVLGDLRAQMASCNAGMRGLVAIAERYTAAGARRAFCQLHDYAEMLARQCIRRIPEGVYSFVDHIDGLGENPEPIEFHASITIKDGHAHVDWTGTSAQVDGGINTHMPYTKSCCYAAIRSVMAEDVPSCAGFTRVISVTAPLGTVVNARFPAPCGARGITGFRMIDCLFGALAKALPERVPADGFGGNSLVAFGFEGNGRREVFVETILGNSGAAAWHDGQDGVPHIGANLANVPIELLETHYPIRVRRYGFVADSGGPGRFRGGLAIERVYELCSERALLTLRTDKARFPPHGLAGGMTGAPSESRLTTHAGTHAIPVLPKTPMLLARGDVFYHAIPGGGGFGNPLERDPDLVLEDLIDGKVTPAQASALYGVIIARAGPDGDAMTIDWGATARTRRILAKKPRPLSVRKT
jgi:N-methylhydantoinase B